MRVLHLYRRYAPDFTGEGIYYQRLIPFLAAIDGSQHEVLVFETQAPGRESCLRFQQEPCAVHYLNTDEHSGSFKLLRWMRRNIRRFDILHVHTHVDRYFLSYVYAQFTNCRVLYSSTLEDSLDELVQTYKKPYRWVVRALFGRLDAFVAIAPRLYSGGPNGQISERAALIPQGVDLRKQEFTSKPALRFALGLKEDEVALLYVGSIIRRKDIGFLIAQLASVFAAKPNVRLYLVGPSPDKRYLQELNELISSYGLFERIVWKDFTESPRDFYAACDLFVFASQSEGFGNVLLEAMSSGLPVVTRYLDGVTSYLIESGENGFLFSNESTFRQQVMQLIDDPALRERIGRCARISVERRFDLKGIASRISRLYEIVLDRGGPLSSVSDDIPGQCRSMGGGPLSVGMRVVKYQKWRPTLSIVIDTESEFDWAKGVSDDRGNVESIPHLEEVQQIAERVGARVCYVVDYPVASTESSSAMMRLLVKRGAEIGAHLQPWTTPPSVEPLSGALAFPGNLPTALERLKMENLRDEIEKNIGVRPRIYKAGRYGLGKETMLSLERLGFDVDLSVAPAFDYSHIGGPNFKKFASEPYWFGQRKMLLELPTTSAFVGPLQRFGSQLWPLAGVGLLKQLHAQTFLDGSGLLSRYRLSPEGFSLRDMCKLTNWLKNRGHRFFTLSLHSSSLLPGFTPYSSCEADVVALVRRIEEYLTFFKHELEGDFMTPLEVFDALQACTRADMRAENVPV